MRLHQDKMITEYQLKVWANEALQIKPHESPLFPPSVYYRFFKILAQSLKPKLSVVLGVCGGGDCLHLALGNPEGQVVGVDTQYDHPDQIDYIYKHSPNFTFWLGDSILSAGEINKKYGQVDLLFIDTTHTLSQTVLEFEAWKPYLADKAIVCFDDLFRKEMDGFWEYLTEPKIRLDNLHDGSESGGGFGVWWR